MARWTEASAFRLTAPLLALALAGAAPVLAQTSEQPLTVDPEPVEHSTSLPASDVS